MNLRTSFIQLFFASLLALGCSVYKSNGRKTFESKAPSNLRASSLAVQTTSTTEEQNHDTCWNQPANEPLWHVDSVSAMNVKQLNQEEIQVCLQAL